MDKNTMISILIADGCTEFDAEKHIKNGAMIYTEAEKTDFIANCTGCGMPEEEAAEEWQKMPEVCHNGVNYKIYYIL